MEDRNAAGSLIDFFSSPDFPRSGLASLEAESSVRVTSQFAVNQCPTTASKFVQLGEENQANQLTSPPVSLSKAEPETHRQDPVEDAQINIPHWFLPNLNNAGAALQVPEPVVGETEFPGIMKNLLGTTPSFEGGGGSSSNGSSGMGMFGGAGFGPGGETGGGGEPGSGGEPGGGGGSGGGGDLSQIIFDVKVQSVTYSGPNFIDIEADPGNDPYPGAPHFVDLDFNGVIDVVGERSLPIGYVRGDTPIVEADFKLFTALLPNSSPPSQKLIVKANDSGFSQTTNYFELPPTPLNVDASGQFASLPATALSSSFFDYVHYGNMSLIWQFSLDGGSNWNHAGTSYNELMVTLEKPGIEGPYYHTIAFVSTQGAAGANNPDSVVEEIWKNKFKDKNLKTAQIAEVARGFTVPEEKTGKQPLHYYKEWNTENTRAKQLLMDFDGQCGAWTELFVKTIGFQITNTTKQDNASLLSGPVLPGVNPNPFYIREVGNQPFPFHGLFINNWKVNGEKHVLAQPFSDYGYINIYGQDLVPGQKWADIKKIDGKWKYDFWDYGKGQLPHLIDQEGVGGQNTTDPASIFNLHIVAYIRGKFYDPSYGNGPFLTVADWEDSSVFGFNAKVLRTAASTGLNYWSEYVKINTPDYQEVISRPNRYT